MTVGSFERRSNINIAIMSRHKDKLAKQSLEYGKEKLFFPPLTEPLATHYRSGRTDLS